MEKAWEGLFVQPLVLSSLNTVAKETTIAAMILGRPSPDPGFGSQVELSGSDAGSLLDLLRIGKALPSERIATEEAPPAFLQVEPAGPSRNEDVMDARMRFQPGARLQAAMTAEIIGDDEDVASRIVSLNVSEQSDIAFGIARSRASGQLLAVTHPQCPIDPGFLGPASVIQRCFDAVSRGRPAWGRIEGARDYWSQFVGADGRRALWRLGVVADDRGPFGAKSLSRGVPQLWVCRHRTPSRRRMRRI